MKCLICRFTVPVTIEHGIRLCLHCDSAPSPSPSSKLRATAPTATEADENGWFVAPASWSST